MGNISGLRTTCIYIYIYIIIPSYDVIKVEILEYKPVVNSPVY